MICQNCHKEYDEDEYSVCPYCHTYAGKTTFFNDVRNNKLTLGDLFRGTFKRHPKKAAAKMFAAGTPLSTPTPDKMLKDWELPWLYARVFLVGIVFAILCYVSYKMGLVMMIYPMLGLAAVIVPLSVLVFYWEINIPRDISIYKVIFIYFIGGMLSIFLVVILPDISLAEPFKASAAAFSEEPTKIIATAIFIYRLNPKYIFGGMLIGAAVGAGFASFETIGYIFYYSTYYFGYALYQGGGLADAYNLGIAVGQQILIDRSLLAVGCHVTWAAIEGGALVAVKGSQKLQIQHFINVNFLKYAAATMAMHFLWNMSVKSETAGDIKSYVLCSAAVGISFILIKQAINQVLQVVATYNPPASDSISKPFPSHPSNPEPNPVPPIKTRMAILKAKRGPLAGSKFQITKRIVIGRDPRVCNVVFPPETKGISRRHCAIEVKNNSVYITDLSSTGTYLPDGRKFPYEKWVKYSGDFCLGSSNIMFSVKLQ